VPAPAKQVDVGSRGGTPLLEVVCVQCQHDSQVSETKETKREELEWSGPQVDPRVWDAGLSPESGQQAVGEIHGEIKQRLLPICRMQVRQH
jgi:hypothetical protein